MLQLLSWLVVLPGFGCCLLHQGGGRREEGGGRRGEEGGGRRGEEGGGRREEGEGRGEGDVDRERWEVGRAMAHRRRDTQGMVRGKRREGRVTRGENK